MCGTPRPPSVRYSFIGYCPRCSEAELTYNIIGLTQPGSVPWKRKMEPYIWSNYGRPKYVCPKVGWKPVLPLDNFPGR